MLRMRKTGLIALLLPTVVLSSCDLTVFDYWIDEDYDLRVFRYSDRSKTVAVDEYYYHGDKYDGEITIDITIPESIGGMPVRDFGRYSTSEISDKFYHDGFRMNQSSDINFAIICSSYFAEGTVINLNINIEADLDSFNLFSPYYHPDFPLEFLNNNDSEDHYGPTPECNLYISINNDNSSNFYSVDGEVYQRRSDGNDTKLSSRNPKVSVRGNLWWS